MQAELFVSVFININQLIVLIIQSRYQEIAVLNFLTVVRYCDVNVVAKIV